MKFPWQRRREQKTANLVQYQNGIYFLGASGRTGVRVRSYIQGYKNCDTVFSCVNLIVQSALNVPWYVYKNVGDEVEEVEKHALYDWMKEPGPGMDWKEFSERSYSYFQAAGNCYIKKRIGSQGKYGRVDVLMPQLVEIKFDRAQAAITSYDYNVNGMILHFRPEEIVHVKTFNPDDPLYGLSVIEAVARQVDIAQMGQEWTLSLLENEARPSGILNVKTRLSEDQRAALRQMLKDEYQGYANAGTPLVTEGDMSWTAMAVTPKEMEFLNSDKVNTRKICAAYRVPPELLGDNENKTYSNVQEARKALYQEAVMPMLERFKSALNRTIALDFDASGTYFLDFDTSGIEALSEDLNSLWQRTREAKASGLITLNEAREAINYEAIEPDIITEPLGANMRLVGDDPTAQPEPTTMPEEPEDEAEPEDEDESDKPKPATAGKSAAIVRVKAGRFWTTPERKSDKWTAFHRRVVSREKPMQEAAAKFLRGQLDRAVSAIKGAPALSSLNRWEILNLKDEADKYADTTGAWYEAAMRQAIGAGVAAAQRKCVGVNVKGGVFTPEHEERLRQMILKSGTKISETTMTEIMDFLDLAETNSWTVEDLTQAIHGRWKDEEVWKARRIAHTESAKVENYGELAGYRTTEFVEYKGWLCALIETSREAHIEADRQYSDNPIKLDDDFIVGGERMAHPGDPSASAGQVCNCLCTMYPSVEEA